MIDELASVARPGLMASAGPRCYGFVIGGSIEAALVADLLTSGWDQCGFNPALSPAAIGFEDVAGAWLKGALAHPGVGVGRLRDGRAGREHRRARSGAPARARAARMERRS